MTYAAAVDKHVGQVHGIAIVATIGGTTYRWATDDVYLSAAGLFIDGLLLDPGSLDRSLESAPLSTGDITVRLNNTAGDFDQFVTNYDSATQNIVRGSFTVDHYVYDPVAGSFDSDSLATFHSGRFVAHKDRTVSLHLSTDELIFGEVPGITVEEVVDAMRSAYPTKYGSSGADIRPREGVSEKIIPYAFGAWEATQERPHDHIVGTHIANISGQTMGSGQAQKYALFAVALNPYGFATTGQRAVALNDDLTIHDYKGTGPFIGSFTEVESLALSSLGNNGLDLLLHAVPLDVAYGQTVGKWSTFQWSNMGFTCQTLFSVADQTSRQLHPADIVQAVLEELASEDRWSGTYVDTTSFTDWRAVAPSLRARGLISKTEPALLIADRIIENFGETSFIDKDGKLSMFLFGQEGAGYTYSSALELTDDDDFLDDEGDAGFEIDSDRFGIVNKVQISIGPNTPPIAVPNAPWLLLNGLEDVVVATKTNATSISNHGRTIADEVKYAPWIADIATAEAVATRMVSLSDEPRAVLRIPASWRAAQLELGEVVKVTEGMVPGWSADRLCIVDGIAHELSTGRVVLTLIDFDDIYTAKVYILDSEANWLVHARAAGQSNDYTASSTSVTCTGWNPSSLGVLAGDFLVESAAPGDAPATNNFIAQIASVAAGSLTLEAGGGEGGALPGANQSGATNWKIIRGAQNRDTPGGSYTARDAKYGVLCGTDDLLTDDATPGFDYGI